ncbi:hypothetical protein [Polymorphospora sp. NPDC050346]|uniref:hypothetical protein n=1 Tax=Polymorphospora sp. NPDC050346 TaxID=3155780 RepID=UPI0034074A3F
MGLLGRAAGYFWCVMSMAVGGLAFLFYDRADEEWVIGPIGVGVGLLGIVLISVAGRFERGRTFILRHGIAGVGTVTAVSKTMRGETEARYLKLTLTVVVPGRSPYQATTRKAYGLSVIDRVQPGLVLPVRVHPTRPEKVLVAGDRYHRPLV